jgi:hypothetical protein
MWDDASLADREARRGAMYANFDWREFIDQIWTPEAVLAEDVMIMNPARFSPVVAMARVCPPRRCALFSGARHNAGRVR